MGNKFNKKEHNSFEKQLSEIKEWQDNLYNPGHYIGTGKIPPHIKNFNKTPAILLFIAIIFLLPSILGIISNFSVENILYSSIWLILGVILLIEGFIKIKSTRHK